MTFSKFYNPDRSENFEILNLLAPIVLLINSLYSAMLHLSIKYLISYFKTTKLLLYSEIILPKFIRTFSNTVAILAYVGYQLLLIL